MAKSVKNEEMTLGKRIQSIRTELGFSMNELAKRVGVSHVQISNYEADSQNPTAATLLRIATELETSTDFLLKGTGSTELADYLDRIKTLSGAEQLNVLKYLKERFEMDAFKRLQRKQLKDVINKDL